LLILVFFPFLYRSDILSFRCEVRSLLSSFVTEGIIFNMMFKRLLMVGGLLSALLFLNGCSYMTNRWNDTKDIGDFGFTFSSKPQFSAYVSAPVVQIIPLGIGKVDGHFFGMGEGQTALWAPHYEKSLGLLVWGEERVSFFHTEEELAAMSEEKRDEAANFMRSGVGGFVQGPWSLKYCVSCPHYIHLGWFGVVVTPRYLQMLDFVLGWTTLDVCQDDNRNADGSPTE
jgi:hypothetical protein